MHTRLFVLLLLPLLIAACRPEEGTQEPPESVQETPMEAAVTSDEVVGTYALVSVNEQTLPGGISTVDECEVQVTEGSVTLDDEAMYELDLLTRAVCDPDEDPELQRVDRVTSEGPYTIEGFEVRFGPAVTDATPDDYEDSVTGNAAGDSAAEELAGEEITPGEPDLYDADRFQGLATLRDSLLTVRLEDGLTTLSFVKE